MRLPSHHRTSRYSPPGLSFLHVISEARRNRFSSFCSTNLPCKNKGRFLPSFLQQPFIIASIELCGCSSRSHLPLLSVLYHVGYIHSRSQGKPLLHMSMHSRCFSTSPRISQPANPAVNGEISSCGTIQPLQVPRVNI